MYLWLHVVSIEVAAISIVDPPLHAACRRGDAETVDELISQGNNVNEMKHPHGFTPLLMACQNGHIDVVRLLIEAGADINQAITDHAVTPLLMAAFHGHVEIISTLVIEGADEALRTTHGENALDIATRKGKLAEYESAFTETALAAAKLRFGRALVEETVIPAMTAVNTSTDNGRDLSRISHRSIPASADLDAELFWREDVAELVFSFLDRNGLIDLE